MYNTKPTNETTPAIIFNAGNMLNVVARIGESKDQLETLLTIMEQCFDIGLTFGVADPEWAHELISTIHGEENTDSIISTARDSFIKELSTLADVEEEDNEPTNISAFVRK